MDSAWFRLSVEHTCTLTPRDALCLACVQAQATLYMQDTTTDGRGHTPGNEPLPWGSMPIPKPEPEVWVEINRAARRRAKRSAR